MLKAYSIKIRLFNLLIIFYYCNSFAYDKGDEGLILSNNNKLLAHYLFDGNTLDSSENNTTATNHNAVMVKDRFGVNNSAYNFNGINSYIEISPSNVFSFSNESFSISLWVKVKDNENTYRTFIVISNDELMPRIEIMKARSGYDNGPIYIQVSQDQENQSTAMSIADGDSLPKDTWLHIVGVADYDNKELKLFINNKLQQSVKLIDHYKMPKNDELIVRIGQSSSSSNNWNKQRHNDSIDDVRIFTGVLSDHDVNNLYKE